MSALGYITNAVEDYPWYGQLYSWAAKCKWPSILYNTLDELFFIVSGHMLIVQTEILWF